MTETIASEMKTYVKLADEIRRLSSELRRLRVAKNQCETNILNYLDEIKKPGVKYENIIFLQNTGTRRARKPKLVKKASAIEVLRKHGIDNTEEIYSELEESMRGEPIMNSKLKIKQND